MPFPRRPRADARINPDANVALGTPAADAEAASPNCASITPHLLIAGGSQPFYAKGNEQNGATNPVQPGAPLPPPPPPKPKVVRPGNTKKPRITRSGKYLACSTGTWSHNPARYAYRWTISMAKGASSRRLLITGKLRGHTVRCSVTASNPAGRVTATSPAFRVR